MSKTVLFQAIQFSICTQFNSIWPIDKALSDATTLGQSGPGGDGREGLVWLVSLFNGTSTFVGYLMPQLL